MEADFRDLVPQRDLAKLLRVTVKTLIQWNRKGVNGMTLAKVKIGRHTYYRPIDVDRFQKLVSGGK